MLARVTSQANGRGHVISPLYPDSAALSTTPHYCRLRRRYIHLIPYPGESGGLPTRPYAMNRSLIHSYSYATEPLFTLAPLAETYSLTLPCESLAYSFDSSLAHYLKPFSSSSPNNSNTHAHIHTYTPALPLHLYFYTTSSPLWLHDRPRSIASMASTSPLSITTRCRMSRPASAP